MITYNLPFELIDYILNYIRTDIGIINKHDYNKKMVIYHKKSNIIKNWYYKYKIDSKMPLLFLDEMENMNKWYIIRLFMKFYPKADLYDWPLYYLKRINKPNIVSDYTLSNKKSIYNYKYSQKAYDVFKFMHKINKNDIIKTGF